MDESDMRYNVLTLAVQLHMIEEWDRSSKAILKTAEDLLKFVESKT